MKTKFKMRTKKLILTSSLAFIICLSGQAQTKDTLVIPKLTFDSTGALIIIPAETSSKNDFDFFVGKWKVHNRLLKINADKTTVWQEFEATQEMYKVLEGIGNIDNFIAIRNGQPFEGMTVRLFNPQYRLWSIYWVDSKYGILGLPPVVGSFKNNVGHFFCKEIINNKNVITVYRWDARDKNNPIWSQTMSDDNGTTWQDWNWTMYMHRIK